MNILTFDIEEWFHCDFISDSSTWTGYEARIHAATDLIIETLAEQKIKGTFFILGWIAEKYPEVVSKIYSEGHEIGCHSYLHDLVHNMDIQSFRKDTDHCLKILENVIGKKVTIYRAPGFSIGENNKWAFEVLAELGIETDCSVFPAAHDYGGYPSFGECKPSVIDIKGYKLKEFPMNTVTFLNKHLVFSGGGYFRIMPYALIKYWTSKSDYVMSYFHPRDFDFDQPKLAHLPLMRKFKSYVGLKTAYPKFLKWISDFPVMSLGEASEKIDWSKAKVISI